MLHEFWERDYTPWWLFLRASLLVGVEALTLSITYWRVSEWNVGGSPITLQCNRDIHGYMSYPCEGTLAFARCFPLLAISVSLVVAARFMLQSRMYYHFLIKKALLNFDKTKFWQDPAVVLLAGCLSVGMLHFAIHLVSPPDVPNSAFAKAYHVWEFISPCFVFFVVFERGCNIEKHLLTINRLYEDDVDLAKEHLNGAQLYAEKQLHNSATEVLDRLKQSSNSVPSSLDGLLDEIIKGATPSKGTLYEQQEQQSSLKGLWPGLILLSRHLTDDDSKGFRRSMQVFMLIFVVVHVLLLAVLCAATARDILDATPGQRPLGAYFPGPLGTKIEEVNSSLYQELGTGYCRDEGMLRPDCYWKIWKDMDVQSAPNMTISTASESDLASASHSLLSVRFNLSRTTVDEVENSALDLQTLSRDVSHHASPALALVSSWATSFQHSLAGVCSGWLTRRALPSPQIINRTTKMKDCGQYCSISKDCIGFSSGADYCTIYNHQHIQEPAGWTKCGIAATTNMGKSQIVQTNQYETAECWKRLSLEGETEDIASAIVGALHICLIAFFMVWTLRYLKPFGLFG